ncbi:MAG: Parvulin-like peptidyl-prolyl isomerase [Chlorobi bacterium OLB7]|nr:MAG: Parvulin-like peptidyl-prolyl isomerase [Chlorobi bacterium OLB7]
MLSYRMMRTPLFIRLLLALLLGLPLGLQQLSAQPKKKGGKNTPAATEGKTGTPPLSSTLLEVANEKFTVQQLADAFQKNANRGGKTFFELSKDSALQFVNLYADYRLKVRSALDQGFDKRPEIEADIAQNRRQLAAAPAPNTGYLIERKVVDPAVRDIFNRRSDELKIALIFSKMDASNPADTLRAYQRTLGLIGQIQNGADFGGIAKDSSDDPMTRTNSGVLGWITSGMILREIEDAAYAAPVGKLYPAPVRVASGYVIVRLMDRQPRMKVRGAHILLETGDRSAGTVAADTTDVWQRAQQTLQRIRNGEDFAAVARQVSDDKVSGENGGDLLSFYTRSLGFEAKEGKLEPAFEDALMSLKDGEVSGIVRTSYGYHIIKRLESHRPTFDEEKETLRQLYKRLFLADDRHRYVQMVMKKQGFQMNSTTLERLLASVNQSRTTADTAWASGITNDLRSQTLFSFQGNNIRVMDWMDTIETHPELRATALNREGVESSIISVLEMPALLKEAESLEQEYPEFGGLMKEFRDGILIFKLEDEAVWSKLKYDSTEGRAFFERHKSDYKTLPKYAVTEILVYKEKERDEAYRQAQAGKIPFDSLAAQYTQRPGYREKRGHWGLATVKGSDLVKQVLQRKPDAKAGDIIPPFEYQSGWSIIRVDQVEPSRPMSFQEAENELRSDYIDDLQNRLRGEWIQGLRKQYKVKVDEGVLTKALAAK